MKTLTVENARDGMTICKRFDISSPRTLRRCRDPEGRGFWCYRRAGTWRNLVADTMSGWRIVEDAPEQPLVCTDRNNPPKLPEGRVDAAGDVLDAMIEHINDGIKYFSRVRDGSMTPGLVSAMAAEAVVRLGKIRRLIHPATGEPKKPTAGEELVDTVKNIRVAGDRLKAAFEAYLGEDNG